MPFKRGWDSSCPQEYDRWETDKGAWVIQDLLPEDDEEALRLLVEQMAPDEELCTASKICEDALSMHRMADYWRICLSKRMSLACYLHEGTTRTLAALNCCLVCSHDDDEDICEIEGDSWQNVYAALHYAETRVNIFKALGTDRVLFAMGLVVRREFRGAKLGARMLAAREPLSLAQGIVATTTVFTSIASQKSAARAGFTTLAEVTFTELSNSGLKYPEVEKSIKLMVKKYTTQPTRSSAL